MVKASREFLIRLKLNDEPIYRICQRVGVNASTLSRLINGIDPVKPGDERIIRVADVLGLSPEEAFQTEESVVHG